MLSITFTCHKFVCIATKNCTCLRFWIRYQSPRLVAGIPWYNSWDGFGLTFIIENRMSQCSSYNHKCVKTKYKGPLTASWWMICCLLIIILLLFVSLQKRYFICISYSYLIDFYTYQRRCFLNIKNKPWLRDRKMCECLCVCEFRNTFVQCIILHIFIQVRSKHRWFLPIFYWNGLVITNSPGRSLKPYTINAMMEE